MHEPAGTVAAATELDDVEVVLVVVALVVLVLLTLLVVFALAIAFAVLVLFTELVLFAVVFAAELVVFAVVFAAELVVLAVVFAVVLAAELVVFAVVLAELVVLPLAGAGAGAGAACETRTQLPKPASVVKLTRQLALSEPPVHFVPAGSCAETWTDPTLEGAATPFFVIATFPRKFRPVAVVSTVADLISVEPSWPL